MAAVAAVVVVVGEQWPVLDDEALDVALVPTYPPRQPHGRGADRLRSVEADQLGRGKFVCCRIQADRRMRRPIF